MRILIVDDEALARTALAQILAARPDIEGFDAALALAQVELTKKALAACIKPCRRALKNPSRPWRNGDSRHQRTLSQNFRLTWPGMGSLQHAAVI